MKITLRTSGGRGEYELAGRHGPFHNWDLKGKPLLFRFGGRIDVPGHMVLSDQGNKPRLRLIAGTRGVHLYRFATGLLLLPKANRELSQTQAKKEVEAENYSVGSIGVKVVSLDKGLLYVENLELESAAGFNQVIDVDERFAVVLNLWAWAQGAASKLGEALRHHRQTVEERPFDHNGIISARDAVLALVRGRGDPLGRLVRITGIEMVTVGPNSESEGLTVASNEEDEEDPAITQVRLVRKARLLLDRGAEGAVFRTQVRGAYRNRCLATGVQLAGKPGMWTAGVEAAHIYPFAAGGGHSTKNGILLCRNAHWAFDQGFLVLSFDRDTGRYSWGWNQRLRVAGTANDCHVDQIGVKTGPVDQSWLPSDSQLWPSPAMIQRLSDTLAGKV